MTNSAKLEIEFAYICQNPKYENCKIDNFQIFLEDDEIFSENNKMLTDYEDKAIETKKFIYDEDDYKNYIIIKISSQEEKIEQKELIDLRVQNTIINLIVKEIIFYVVIKNLNIIPYYDMTNEFIVKDILNKSIDINSKEKVKCEQKNFIQSKNIDKKGTNIIEKDDEKKNYDTLDYIEINESKNNFNNLDVKNEININKDKSKSNSLIDLVDIRTFSKSPAADIEKIKKINVDTIISDESPNSTSITVTEEKHDITKEEIITNDERIDKLFEEFRILKKENHNFQKENQNFKKENQNFKIDIQNFKKENLEIIKKMKIQNNEILNLKKDIKYLKRITNPLGIRIFIEKFLYETDLKLNFNNKTDSLIEAFMYIFRILGDEDEKNTITDNDVEKNLFFSSKKDLIEKIFKNKNNANYSLQNLIKLSKDCNKYLHFSEINEQNWENSEIVINGYDYYTSMSNINIILDSKYSIKLNK